MRSLFFSLAFLFFGGYAHSQSSILSPKHIKTINKRSVPVQKLELYRKFYKRDSTKQAKKTVRYWKAKSDSLTHAAISNGKARRRQRGQEVEGVDDKKGVSEEQAWAKKLAAQQVEWMKGRGVDVTEDSSRVMEAEFERYFLETSQDDSSLFVLKQQIPDMECPPHLKQRLETYQTMQAGKLPALRRAALGKMPELPTKEVNIGGIASKENAVEHGREILASKTSAWDGMEQLSGVQGELDAGNKVLAQASQYKQQIGQMQDSAYLKEQAKKLAEEKAMEYLTANPGVQQAVQKKMSLLMRKYSVVPNSNDLSTAVKRVSLKGKPLRQRLYVAGNLQVVNLDPVCIDFSPMVGYRLNAAFIAGIGGHYRQTFSDTLKGLSADVIGYKAFASYDVVRRFFAYGEFERNSPGIGREKDKRERLWKNAAFLGVGRKMTISTRIEMTALVLYNFLHSSQDPVYPSPWVFRIGFQTGGLGFLK